MNSLFADIGYQSLSKYGEQLCGDCVQVVEGVDGSLTAVLADGLGSGVKASILSTLTAKILSTMISEGLAIEACVETIAATLPVCSVREVAYSTFTLIKLNDRCDRAEIIQYDNPGVILFRNGVRFEIPTTSVEIGGKTILITQLALREGDLFVMMSDGCVYAGTDQALNYNWKREDIVDYLEPLSEVGFTAKTINTILLDQCSRLYGGRPGDDMTACTVRIRRREVVHLMIGPPSNREDVGKMMSLFFSKEGRHVVCGGTTSALAASFLGKELRPGERDEDSGIPPISYIDGVDLVTEGTVTIRRVLDYAEDYLRDNREYASWCYNRDAASQIAKMLFEEATDIIFYVGRAVNPAHQTSDLPLHIGVKMQIVEELSDCLRKMGKKVKISYF